MTVRKALAEGREKVAQALAVGATINAPPAEETLSWILQSEAAWRSDRILVRPFTRHEENRYSGADWIWWWQGAPGEWFGCLVQAKHLKQGPSGPTFDFAYTPNPTKAEPTPPAQIQRLLSAADTLQVPAAYMLYRSPSLDVPGPWACSSIAPTLATGAATFVAAGIVFEWWSNGLTADLRTCRPVECLSCDGRCGHDAIALAWYAAGLADDDLRAILRKPPTTPARRALRALFAQLAELRSAQFRGRPPDEIDRTHAGFPLGQHFAQGVRAAPWYVEQILSNEVSANDLGALAADVGDVAGVVVVLDD